MLRILCCLFFLIPLCFFPSCWWLICSLLFAVSFLFLFSVPFFCWGNLGYLFGCDLISYGLILLSLWICVLIILARESIFRVGYFPGFFVFVVIFLAVRKSLCTEATIRRFGCQYRSCRCSVMLFHCIQLLNSGWSAIPVKCVIV
jgi:hypothetical protein